MSSEERRRISFRDVGWKAYSQTDEDGIILYLLATLGAASRRCVEVAASNGQECNTANLLINHYYDGLLLEGDPGHVREGIQWYATHSATYVYPPRFVSEWVTAENINSILDSNGYTGEVDLLSIDVDGIDYWLWQAVDTISPRIVVIEYQPYLGSEESWTVPYDPHFKASDYPMMNGWLPTFCGASLLALVRLGERKGYRLVGSNSLCFNAFFVRSDLGVEFLPTATVESCLDHQRVSWSIEHRFPIARQQEWQEV